MTIKIICVGKIKRAFLSGACEYYKKLLSRFCKCEIIECPDFPSERENVLLREAERVIAAAKTCDYVVAMDISGAKMASEAFAERLTQITLTASTIGFIIGSSHGLSEDALRLADLKLSFSDMTFPHQLFRVMLLEQIYRAFTIGEGHPYHK